MDNVQTGYEGDLFSLAGIIILLLRGSKSYVMTSIQLFDYRHETHLVKHYLYWQNHQRRLAPLSNKHAASIRYGPCLYPLHHILSKLAPTKNRMSCWVSPFECYLPRRVFQSLPDNPKRYHSLSI